MVENKSKLTGINSKCSFCTGECKQFEQVKVIVCPNYVDKYRGKSK